MEDRILLVGEPPIDTAVTLVGGTLTITDAEGGTSNDNLTISYSGGTYTITDTGGLIITTNIAGSSGDVSDTVTIPDTAVTGIVLDVLGGDDLVTVNSVQPALSDGFTITGGAGFDRAIVNGAINTSGTGAVDITTSGPILLNSGSSLTTVDGGITLNANPTGSQLSDFTGLEADNALIQTTGTGNIQLTSEGSGFGNDTSDLYGVYLHTGTSVGSTATGASAGTITISGDGGDGTSLNHGVYLSGSSTDVTSVDGNILITGSGGGGSGAQNYGVYLDTIETIESSGVGANAATITINGTGGDGTRSNYGVYLTGSTTDVTSVVGDILITGRGGAGSSGGNLGVFLNSIETIESRGTGADSATITINGTGGDGTDGNSGVVLFGGTTDVTSVNGDISITGYGGNGTLDRNMGVSFSNIEKIESTGTGTDAATITITGTGGDGTVGNYGSNYGVQLSGSTTDVTSVDGDISITGYGGDGLNENSYGVYVNSIEKIESTGTGVDAATITINGTGGDGDGTDSNYGVHLSGNTTDLISVMGAISITGTGGDGDFNNSGVYIQDVEKIESTGIGAGAATITINGTGGSGSARNHGVEIAGGTLTSVDGDILITGLGGGDGSNTSNYGVGLFSIGTFESTGTGANAASITINGTGGNGTFSNHGVFLTASTTDVTSVAGDISITGTGGIGSNNFNSGVVLQLDATVQVTSGQLSVTGTATSGDSQGIRFGSSGARLVSVGTGDIVVTADGNGPLSDLETNDDSIIGGPNATGDITINADLVDLSGTLNVQSTGALTIQPHTANTTIGLGGGTGTLNLDDTELGFLVDGFSSITIGNATSGDINIDTATFNDPLNLITGGEIHDGAGTDLNMAGGDTVTVNGVVAPGQSPGILSVSGDFAFADNSTFEVEIGGTTPGANQDQIDATGSVSIGTGVTLDLVDFNSFGASLVGGETIEIINRTGGTGTFDGLPEGASISNFQGSARSATISYVGGDGDDVVITVDDGETEVSLVGGVLTIQDINGGTSNDDLSISYSGGTYTITDHGGLQISTGIAGTTGDGTASVTIPNAGVTGIVFDLIGGDDTVTVDSVQPGLPSGFTITGGAGFDRAIVNGDIATTGTGAVDITTSGPIVLNAGSSLTTVDGGITLNANSTGAQTADFIGLEANDALIQTTGTGNIQLTGKSSETGNDTRFMHGIFLDNGTSVSSTLTGSSAGTISIDGTGGNGTDHNYGVYLTGVTTELTSVSGEISITGHGGDGSSQSNYGVYVSAIETIASLGTGPDAATITVTGTGGAGTSNNHGVYLTGSSTDLTSVDGDISITGTGGVGSGQANSGTILDSIQKIESLGTGATAAKITINGTVGTGTRVNRGVYLHGGSTDVLSVDGDITIIGTSGSDGSGNGNLGVFLAMIGKIESSGTGADAAKITITGTGGNGTTLNYGVYLSGNSTDVTSMAGDISITGTGGVGSGDDNHGIRLINDSTIQVTTGLLTVNGTAAAGDSPGVSLHPSSGGRLVSVGTGSIIVNAEGSGTSPDFKAGADSVIGGPTATGDITINADSVDFSGTTNVQSTGNLLIQPRTANTSIGIGSPVFTLNLDDTELGLLTDGFSSITIGNATSGDINIETATFTDPLHLITGGEIHDAIGTDLNMSSGDTVTAKGVVAPGQSPGILAVAGDFAFANGSTYAVDIGGSTPGTNQDQIDATGSVSIGTGVTLDLVDFNNFGATIVGGESFEIINRNGGTGTFDGLAEGASISDFLGSGLDATISYTGGDGDDVVLNIEIPVPAETEISLVGGVLTIADINGGTSNDNLSISYAGGIYTITDNGGLTITTGIAGATGDGTDTVTIPDTGVTGIEFDVLDGDDLVTVDSVQAALSGGFTVKGEAGFDRVIINADIATTGTGVVDINTSGPILLNSGSSLTTVDGGITLDANAAGAQTADFRGLQVNNAMIQTTGTGNIQLLGKGAETGNDTSFMFGVYLHNGTSVSSTAIGSSAGTIMVNGTGGDGSSSNFGVILNGSTTEITSVDGAIEITGNGGDGSSSENYGVYLNHIDKIESTGKGADAATITINGTGGDGTEDNQGVLLSGNTTDVTSVDGAISITGQGGDGSGGINHGVHLNNIETISSTGMGANAATITINGTGGDGTFDNSGVFLTGSSTDVRSVDGAISITGQGGIGSSNRNNGVILSNMDRIESTGMGPNAATITINGTGGDGRSGSGVSLSGGTTNVTSVDGAIAITGNGSNGSSSGNHGVINSAATIQSTGLATITANGAGGGTGSSSFNQGVFIQSGNWNSGSSQMTITGTGGNGASDGVRLNFGGLLTGSGNIVITGTGTDDDPDLFLDFSGAEIGGDTATGDITLNVDTIQLNSGTQIDSDGALVIQPRTAGNSIGLGDGTGTLNLIDTEIAVLQDGFSSITIGDVTSGDIDIDTATFNDPLTLITGGEIHDGAGTDINMASGDAVTANGTVAPGQSPGILNITGNFAFANNSIFEVEIGGTSPGTANNNHDRIDATGSVSIGTGVTLDLVDFNSFGATITGGETFEIINRTSGTGTFDGLLEGATISDFLGSGLDAKITYTGGDGDDVVLDVVIPVDTEVTFAGGVLTITDIDGGTSDDDLKLFYSDGFYTLVDQGGLIIDATDVGGGIGSSVTFSASSITGITFDTLDGTDTVTVVSLSDAVATDLVVNSDASDTVNLGAGNTTTVVDALNDVGKGTSLAIVNGNPAIAYNDSTSKALKFAVNDRPDGSGNWITTTIDPDHGADSPSMAIINGFPTITYYHENGGDRDLRFAINDKADGTGNWTTSSIGSNGSRRHILSLAEVDGNPAVTYFDRGPNENPNDLVFARNTQPDGSGTWNLTTIDSAGIVGAYSSLQIVDGRPAISYQNGGQGNLKYAINSQADGGGAWSVSTIDSAGYAGEPTSHAIVDGNPAIAYGSNGALKYARNTQPDASGTWEFMVVDNVDTVGGFASLSVVNGKPAVSYYDYTNDDLRVAFSDQANGLGTWSTQVVDSDGDVGNYGSSAAVAGRLGISYHDTSNADLKFAWVAPGDSAIDTGGGDITVSGATINVNADLVVGSGNLSLTTDAISISDDVSGTGTLLIQPLTPNTSIGLGSPAFTLNLDDDELGFLADGFSGITIGNTTSGDVNIDTATFTDPLNLITGGEIHDGAGTDLTVAIGDTVTANGTIAPGQSPGILSVAGDFAFANDSTFEVEIGGNTPGANLDQIGATGSVTIGTGVTLDLVDFNNFGAAIAGGESFELINRTGGSGTFDALEEGATISDFLGSGLDATISYTGGDGDDVVLSVQEAVNLYAAYDFNFRRDPQTETDFTPVALGDVYTLESGYGWQTALQESFDTQGTDDLNRDYHFFRRGGSATFLADLPNGNYEIEVTIGSNLHKISDEAILLNGMEVGVANTDPGEFHVETYQVTVEDGQLNLTLEARGRTIAVLNGLRIFTAGPQVNGEPVQVSLSNTATQFVDNLDTTNRIKVADIEVIDDGLGTNQFTLSGADAGLFEVIGDELFLIAGATLDATTNPVLDVNVEVDDTSVGNTPDVSTSLSIDVIAATNLVRSFDFNERRNPFTQAGSTGVGLNDVYSSAQGYGWQTALQESFDTKDTNDFDRDYQFFRRGGSATFLVDLVDGIYDIELTIGSNLHKIQDEAILLNGTEVDLISTNPGAFHVQSYRVTVVGGQLNLTLEARGRTIAIINGLKIFNV